MKKRKVILVAALVLTLAACGASHQSQGQRIESDQQKKDETALVNAQPIPGFNYSQKRANLIEIETAEANGAETTSFFFNLGVQDPIKTCPSIGAPIPAGAQISNPQQPLTDNGDLNNGGGNITIDQMDPTGIYDPGNSTGTYVICVGANGKAYASYWEGYVDTEFGAAKWDETTHSVTLVGPPSFSFTKEK